MVVVLGFHYVLLSLLNSTPAEPILSPPLARERDSEAADWGPLTLSSSLLMAVVVGFHYVLRLMVGGVAQW